MEPEEIKESEEVKEITSSDVIGALIKAYSAEGEKIDKDIFNSTFKKYLQQLVTKNEISKKYNIVIIFDEGTMLKSDADKIYSAVTTFKKNKPILMVLLSNGGEPGSAYLIGKLCREYSNGKFSITVPRQAKSSATLLCCAANEIHMGSLSELGPIDPQIKGLPALGLKNSIEHIAELVAENPKASEMFARYLNLSIEPIQIGYYERVAESAMQYAEKLLNTHSSDLPREAKVIADELVYKYKDHGFVIDKSEAEIILGKKVIKHNTPEYVFGNTIYQFLEFASRFSGYLKHTFYFIGGIDSEPTFIKRRN